MDYAHTFCAHPLIRYGIRLHRSLEQFFLKPQPNELLDGASNAVIDTIRFKTGEL